MKEDRLILRLSPESKGYCRTYSGHLGSRPIVLKEVSREELYTPGDDFVLGLA